MVCFVNLLVDVKNNNPDERNPGAPLVATGTLVVQNRRTNQKQFALRSCLLCVLWALVVCKKKDESC